MKALIFFKALSDPTRLNLVLELRAQESLCVCDLTQQLAQPQSTISRHLNHLKQANIVVSERRGTWIWYALNPNMPDWCHQTITAIYNEVPAPKKPALRQTDCSSYRN